MSDTIRVILPATQNIRVSVDDIGVPQIEVIRVGDVPAVTFSGLFTDLDFTGDETVQLDLKADLTLHSSGDNSDNSTFTVDNSGIKQVDVNGVEMLRVWTDGTFGGDILIVDQIPTGFISGGSADNVLIGTQIATNVEGVTGNVAIGNSALQDLTTGNANTSIGTTSGYATTDGDSNTFVGSNSVALNPSATGIVIVGSNAYADTGVAQNAIAIGSATQVTIANTAVIGNGSVTDVYFGSTAGNAILHGDGSVLTNLPSTGVPTSRTLTIGPDTQDLSVNRTWLSNVTDDLQTKAAIVPNTAPSAGKLLVGNVGGTAYAPVSISGSGVTVSLASTGVLTLSAIANATLSNSLITIAGTSTSLGGAITLDTIDGLATTGLVKRTGANTRTTITDNSSNWDTAFSQTRQWDGGSTGLVAATGRTSLALVIGTNVQAWDDDLDTWATLTPSSNFQTMVPHTFAQMRSDLSLVIGTNIQAWDADLDSWAAITRASGFDTFTTTPSSANLRGLLTDETGSGAAVFGTSPTMSDPVVGTQSTSDNSTKAASTAYVTTAIANAVAGVNPAVAVQAATTSASDTSALTYNNGVSGIGATLTGANNTALTVDGYTFTAINQRLLVKNDTQSPSGAFNGMYYVTQVQAALLPLILTRALDYDAPSDINNTGAIPVVNGTVNGTTSWVLTSSVATVGTDPLTFTEFSLKPSTLVLTSRTLTIGPTSQDLSTDRTWLGSVTNDAQTKAAVVPNTTPTAGQLLVGNAGGTAYAPVTLSGVGATATLSSAGVLTLSSLSLNTSGSAATLTTARGIYGNNFDGSAALTQIIASTYGGTGNGFTKFSGPTTSERTKTMRDASDTVLELGGSYTPTGTWTSLTMVTPVLGTPASGVATNLTGTASALNIGGSAASLSISGQTGLITVAGLTSTNRIKTVRDAADTILELGGSYTPTGTWTSLTMVTPVLGTPTSGTLTNVTGTADGLTAGDVTRNHAVYAGASPPTVDVGLFIISKTGVDMKTSGTTTVFAVPTGRTFICTGAWFVVTSVTSGGAGTQTFKIQESGGSLAMTQSATSGSGTPVVGGYYAEQTVVASGQFKSCAAGNNVQVVVATSQAGSTAVSGTIFVQGFYSA